MLSLAFSYEVSLLSSHTSNEMPWKGPARVDEGPVLSRSVGYCAPALELVLMGTD